MDNKFEVTPSMYYKEGGERIDMHMSLRNFNALKEDEQNYYR